MGTNVGPIVKYKCANDCEQAGCPGHIIRENYNRTSDTFYFEIDGKPRHYFDPYEFKAMIDAHNAYRVQQHEGTPIRGELNPNHPVTREMRENWHKLLAIIMHKHGLTNVQITPDDVQRMGEFAVMADARGKELWVRLLPKDEAEKLCRAAGGFVV